MTFEQIRVATIMHMAEWVTIPGDDVDYPNSPRGPFKPDGRPIWVRLVGIPGASAATEIGNGPCVRHSNLIIVQLFVPIYKDTLLLTRTADTLREYFEFYSDPVLPFRYFVVSQAVPGDDRHDWYQANLMTPYQAGRARLTHRRTTVFFRLSQEKYPHKQRREGPTYLGQRGNPRRHPAG